jgi:FMN phosphatase YigB (HAD superfamily)
MNNRIRLVIMDLYGIISLGSYWDVTFWLAKKYHIDPEKIYGVLYHKYFNMAAMGKITERQLFVLALEELGIDMDWKTVRDKHLTFQKLNMPAVRLCQELEEHGYTILLLSKNIPPHFSQTKKRFGLRKYFRHITNTYDLGLAKASKETMLWALTKFKVKPEEVLLCDDQDFNLVEAGKMGIKTVLYTDFRSFKRSVVEALSEKG